MALKAGCNNIFHYLNNCISFNFFPFFVICKDPKESCLHQHAHKLNSESFLKCRSINVFSDAAKPVQGVVYSTFATSLIRPVLILKPVVHGMRTYFLPNEAHFKNI